MARDVRVKIIGDADSYRKALKQSEQQTQAFEGAVKKSHAALMSMAAGMLGAGGVVVGLEQMVSAAKAAQESQDHLAITMKDAGLSYDANRKAIEAVIAKQSELSGFQKTDVRDTYAALIRQTKDVSQANTDLALAVDIARGRHIDLASAQQIVIKANMGLVGALKRMGIEIAPVKDAMNALTDSHKSFTTAQKEAAKQLDLAATKQKAIALLQQTYAGQAKAYGDSSAGAADRFKSSLTNLEVTLGTALLPTLTNGLKHVTAWVNHLNDSGKAARYAKEGAHVLSGVIADATPIVKGGAKAFRSLADALGGDKQAVEALGGALAAWKLAGVFARLGTDAGEAGAAGSVGLLNRRLNALKMMGPIAVVVALQFIHKSSKGQQLLDSIGLGVLGKLPVIGGLNTQAAVLGQSIHEMLGGSKFDSAPGLQKGLAGVSGRQANIVAVAQTVEKDPSMNRYVYGGGGAGGPTAALGTRHDSFKFPGFDCSGFVQYVMAQNGIQVPRTSQEQAAGGIPVPKGQLAPGDIVFTEGWPHPGHVGIYIGDGKVIHDPHTGASIATSTLKEFGWNGHAVRYWKDKNTSGMSNDPMHDANRGGPPSTPPPSTTNNQSSIQDIINQGTPKHKPHVLALAGSKLLSHATQLALAKAGGTKGTADDLTALEAAATELRGMPQSVAVATELANVEKRIHAIQQANLKAHLAAQTAEWKKHAAEVAASLKAQDTAWKAHIQELKNGAADAKRIFDRSFGEASNELFKQFDRLTQMGLTSLDSERQQLTPSEQKLADAAKQRAKLSNDRALQTAEIGLKSAGLNVTNLPSQAADWSQLTDQQQAALDSYYQALNAVNDAQLQEQATAERKARDQEYADKAQAYQDQRDLDRQKLQNWLDDQKIYLDAGKTKWDAFYAELKKKAADGGWDIGSAFWDAWNAAAAANSSSTQASNQAASAATGPSGDVGGFYQVIQQSLAAGTMTSAQAAFYKSGHKMEIPEFADGGPVTRTGLALVHAGEHVVPKDGALVVAGGGGGDTVHHHHIYVDGREIFESVQRESLRNKFRNGKNGLG